MSDPISDELKKGDKHLMELTFRIKEQQLKATYADSYNSSQTQDDNETFTTPSMEDMLKKENAMIMDLVKVVSNNIANGKQSGSPQDSENAQPQIVEIVQKIKPGTNEIVPSQTSPLSGNKRTEGSVPGDGGSPSKENSGLRKDSMPKDGKKQLQKATIKNVNGGLAKNLNDGKQSPSGGNSGLKGKGQKLQNEPIVSNFQDGRSGDELIVSSNIKPSDSEPLKKEMKGNSDNVDDGELKEIGGTGELMANGDDGGDFMEMDEKEASKNKNSETVERIVVEESKKWKSKLTETFENDSDDANSSPNESMDVPSPATEENIPNGDQKIVDKTAKMLEAISVLYKLAGNESRPSRDEKPSNPGENKMAMSSAASQVTSDLTLESSTFDSGSSSSTSNATAKRNRTKKFISVRNADDITTNGPDNVDRTPWTQNLQYASPEDAFTEEVTSSSATSNDPHPKEYPRNTAVEEQSFDRLQNEEPSTIDIADYRDDFTTGENIQDSSQ